MSGRPKGSRDLKPRQPRSDRGKKRKKYKPHKDRKFQKYRFKKKYGEHGKFVRYVSKRQKSDPIKIWFWEQRPMSKSGIMKWHKRVRPIVAKKIYKFGLRVNVDPSDISNPEKIKTFAINVLGVEGTYFMMGFSRGRNRFKVKPVKLCRIRIVKTSDGEFKAFVDETNRLSRYWFYRHG